MLRILLPTVLFLILLFSLIYFATFSWLFDVAEPTTEAETVLKQLKAEIFEKFFEIFVTVTAIIAGFAVTIAIAVFNLLKNDVIQSVENRVLDSVMVSQTFPLLTTFVQLSMDEYWEYEPHLERYLLDAHGSQQPNLPAVAHAKRALTKANVGFEIFERLSEPQKAKFVCDKAHASALLNLLNHRFYAQAAIFLMNPDKRSIGVSEQLSREGMELLDRAENLRKVASKDSLSSVFDTVISCLYVLAVQTENRNLKLECVKRAQRFINGNSLSLSTSVARQADIDNIKLVLSSENV